MCAILSSLITVIRRNSLIRVYTLCHTQHSDQGLHCLPFSTAVWSASTLFAILSKHYYHGIDCLPFSAVWSGSTLSFSAVCSGTILFDILSSLIKVKVHTVILRDCLVRVYTMSFSKVWSAFTLFAILSSLNNVYTVCHSRQSNQGLYYFPFSAVWSGSTVFAILSILIRVYTIFHLF